MTSKDDRIQDRARRIGAEDRDSQATRPGEPDPAALSPEEAETVRANKALNDAANRDAPSSGSHRLDLGLDEIPPAD